MIKRKLILLISHDPHARAVVRCALEAEGFLVGEAANGKEGERTIRRVQPDAVIGYLQLEIVEGGESVIERLREADTQNLFYQSAAQYSIRSASPALGWR